MMALESGPMGLFARFFCLLFSVLPCVIVGRWGVAPGVAVWVLGATARLAQGDRGVVVDCAFFGVWNLVGLRGGVVRALGKSWDVRVSIVLGAIVPLAVFGLLGQRRYGSQASFAFSRKGLSEGTAKWTMEHPKSLFFPCRTTHARIFPKRHGFGYSYLLCGFPIVPAGTTGDGSDVGDGNDRMLGSWWLGVRAEDYLARGYGSLGFYEKLKAYLREQGVENAEWSYAYLITAPRFFGYSFNPVSFWYIYNQDHELKKMVLEVNNTFGERRIYVLDGSPARTPGSEISESHVSKNKFTDVWMKDFHVSPFNSRKGSYALKALNPFPSPTYSDPAIDNTITLKSSKDHTKVVARVYTTGQPLDPAHFGIVDTLRFIGGWWWVGLVTFPRIIREAFKLYFLRSLHVWFRPEIISSSIGRAPTPTEVTLQKIFQEYLKYLVNTVPEPFSLNYQTAIPDNPHQTITTPHQCDRDRNVNNLDIRITTPAFYSRFVHYAHTSEAFDRECLFTDGKNRTLWISQPELLPLLLPKSGSGDTHTNTSNEKAERGHLDELRWTILRKLRCPPAEPAYVVTPKSDTFDIGDIRTMQYSELDHFMRGPGGRAFARDYRRMVTNIFLAQRFALGFMEVIDLLDFGVRAVLCWVGAKKVSLWEGSFEHTGKKSQWRGNGAVEWCWMSGMAVYISSCHLYGLLKG
ncbi:DUF1365-domain-containing protein [Lentithecium fluviatile CBS 122367]|uniref:DUF1365-domain-containing protein n=1 Tax=Lentithecium fluviatile CBS 122367 TaxID=1168545 RepID=A0A6G1IXY3_9PLEO|nr:DUF1365-domain-containing protein [Lentithecium fluviatile CBS 122367]